MAQVAAVMWISSLAWELPATAGTAKKKKKNYIYEMRKDLKILSIIHTSEWEDLILNIKNLFNISQLICQFNLILKDITVQNDSGIGHNVQKQI